MKSFLFSMHLTLWLNCVFVFLIPVLLPCLLVRSLLYFHFPEIAFENGKPCKVSSNPTAFSLYLLLPYQHLR